MIFVTIGTHPQGFERLIKKIDQIAPEINEEIIIQRGFTKYVPKNCKFFEFDNLQPYFKKARLVICHSATSLLEFSLEYKKPVITVPRQARYKEHINDHQVDFALFFAQKTGIKAILNMNDITPELLESYNSIPVIKKNNLIKLQSYFKDLFNKEQLPKPFAHNRIDYLVNLLDIKKEDRILNIGISNIPEVEMQIEDKVKECVTIDFDSKKLEKAKKYLNKTKLIQADITKYNKFKDNYFDKIVVVEVLEHLDDDYQALKWINSILKKNGTLIVGVPNDAFLHYFNPVKYAEHKRHYSNEMIKKALEKNGFKIVHFNLVERFTLLVNLYIHLFFKFFLKRTIKFGTFTRLSNNSYKQLNKKGMDILVKAIKIK